MVAASLYAGTITPSDGRPGAISVSEATMAASLVDPGRACEGRDGPGGLFEVGLNRGAMPEDPLPARRDRVIGEGQRDVVFGVVPAVPLLEVDGAGRTDPVEEGEVRFHLRRRHLLKGRDAEGQVEGTRRQAAELIRG